jgi:hypothetical protein
MNTFEFPESAITYFYFVPDIHDRVFVEKGKFQYAAIAIDGLVAIDPETNEPSTQYAYQPEFQPQIIKLAKTAYEKIVELVEEIENPFDTLNAVCVGIMRHKDAPALVPFLAVDQETNTPTRTNLSERRGEEALLTAISQVSSILPVPPPVPRGKKRKTPKGPEGEVGKLPLDRTHCLHTLLDLCNELPQEQLEELLKIVEAASVGRYIIKLRPSDMNLPHIQTAKGETKS